MLHRNDYLAQRLHNHRLRNDTCRAERERVLREAGVDQRGWVAYLACKLLRGMGSLLVALGHRLQLVDGPSGASPVTMAKATRA
jgi:hypothetical protein